jgi:hypothetical protein
MILFVVVGSDDAGKDDKTQKEKMRDGYFVLARCFDDLLD